MLEFILILGEELHHLLFGDHLPVDADAFAEINQVRRGEEPGLVAEFLEIGGKER